MKYIISSIVVLLIELIVSCVYADSDIDLAIVSSNFGKDRFEGGKLLLKLAWRVDSRIQPLPFSLDAIEKSNWIPLIHEIKKNGVEITV